MEKNNEINSNDLSTIKQDLLTDFDELFLNKDIKINQSISADDDIDTLKDKYEMFKKKLEHDSHKKNIDKINTSIENVYINPTSKLILTLFGQLMLYGFSKSFNDIHQDTFETSDDIKFSPKYEELLEKIKLYSEIYKKRIDIDIKDDENRNNNIDVDVLTIEI